ncbi:MAG: amidohydrolase [Methanothrix sp.]|nr:amidohydrolase [Methanothrix sp.]
MKRYRNSLLDAMLIMAIIFSFSSTAFAQTKNVEADLLLLNGTVYTVNEKINWDKLPQQAIAIAGKKIAYVGNDSGTKDYLGPKTRIVDLEGKMVLPGFIEAHVHPSTTAFLLAGVNLFNVMTSDDCLKLIKNYTLENPNASVIRGFGWNYAAFGPNGPTKELLDSIVPDKPVMLFAMDGHSAWVNSKALEIAGVDNKTPNPLGGIIEHDSNGNPSGTLRELSAQTLVLYKLTPPSKEEIMQGMIGILDMMKGSGITTTHDSGVFNELVMKAYSNLEKEGKLDVRIKDEQVLDPGRGVEQIPALVEERNNYSSGLVQMKTAKLFIDGVIEGHTALLLEPYIDRPGFKSSPIWKPETFNDTIATLDKAGFQIEVHAVGDGAVRMALDAYQRAQEMNGKRDSRHKIAHVILISPQDLPRFKTLGVIPALSPNWFCYDSTYETNTLAFLGPDRAERTLPMKSFIDTGAIVVIGTDFPGVGDYLTMNPLDEIEAGMTRLPLSPNSNITKPYWPEERVDLKIMIECATINGAYASFMENDSGSLEVGKLADLIVIDRDLFKVPTEDINKAHVLTTILEGREVFGAFKENETVSLGASELDELSTDYRDLFKDVAKGDVQQAGNLLAELDGDGAIYKNNTLKTPT